MHFVPDGRNHQLKMGVVGQQGFPRGRVRSADHPIVASQTLPNVLARFRQKVHDRLRQRRREVRSTICRRRDTRTPQLGFQNRIRLHFVVIIVIRVRCGALRAVIDHVGIAHDKMIHGRF